MPPGTTPGAIGSASKPTFWKGTVDAIYYYIHGRMHGIDWEEAVALDCHITQRQPGMCGRNAPRLLCTAPE